MICVCGKNVFPLNKFRKEDLRMGITIYDVLDLIVPSSLQVIEVYDLDQGESIFQGYANELEDEIANMEISSIDTVSKDTICFNVNSEN